MKWNEFGLLFNRIRIASLSSSQKVPKIVKLSFVVESTYVLFEFCKNFLCVHYNFGSNGPDLIEILIMNI